ncbi:MAG: type II toxin-antitoxin system VapC family toxin [Planctomycetes bacterium]|nr:type II toxin-antitoxin system VapC family toxin [Planctomycetota bacterium]
MIVLDTHIWVWWVHGDPQLSGSHAKLIEENEDHELGICTISLWEVAKLVELGRLVLPISLEEWFANALAYPGVTLVDFTPSIAIESTQLPGKFHRDPADQIIVASARTFECELLTADQRIQDYQHVRTP